MFARELELGTEVAVRNNVAVVMCDLCVRYTNIVDHYIPNLSACLRDDEAVVREQTLIMLTGLLQVLLIAFTPPALTQISFSQCENFNSLLPLEQACQNDSLRPAN